MTDETPASTPSPNGAAFKPDAGTLIGRAAGKAVAAELGPVLGSTFAQLTQFLPQLVAQGVAQALQQVPVRTRRLCAKCLATRIGWEAAHEPEMKSAITSAMAANGITDERDPRIAQLELAPFLPDHLQPGSGSPMQMPQIMDAVTVAAGDEVCPVHLPGTPQQPGRRGLLIPPPGMTASAAARLVSQT